MRTKTAGNKGEEKIRRSRKTNSDMDVESYLTRSYLSRNLDMFTCAQ